MLLISHRGNISGRNPERENTAKYIEEALNLGYWVEVDLWQDACSELFFGHDCYSGEKADKNLLLNPKILAHCKDRFSLDFCWQNNLNFFFHEKDFLTVSSKGWVIAHSETKPTKNTIHMLPEIKGYSKESLKDCAGVCSDTISFYA